MKALRIHKFGGPEQVVWEDIDPPAMQEGHCRVAVKAGALNHLDHWVREELPGVPVELPLIQGCDMAGEVLEVGAGVDHLQVGDRVFLQPGYGCGQCDWCACDEIHYCRKYGIYGETCDGNFCDEVVRPAANLFQVPDNLDWAQAAALPLVSLTSWEMLVEKAALQVDEDLLVLGASSGIGSMAIQIGKLFGARVTAVTSGTDNAQYCKDLGADHVIDRLEHERFSKVVKELTGKKGADVIFEHTGEKTLPESFKCLATGGRLVTCGGTTGPKLEVDVRFLFSKQWSVLGSTMGGARLFDDILPHVAEGRLKPVVGETFAMSEGAEAQRRLVGDKKFGKIVLMNEPND